MHKSFLTSLKESPFIEGMGRILDFRGNTERATAPARSDAEALNEDWGMVLGDYKHSILLVEGKSHDRKKATRQK
jgi:hypothetical protein